MSVATFPPVRDLQLDPVSAWRDESSESLVLGNCLQWPEDQVSRYRDLGLVAGDFGRDAHQRIWRAALAVHDRGETADFPTIRRELAARGDLETVGPAFLASLGDGCPRQSPANAGPTVEHLRQLARCRVFHYFAAQKARSLEADPSLIDSLPDELQALLGSGAAASGPRLLSEADLAQLPPVEELVVGRLPRRGVAMLYADPGRGKTLVAVDLALSIPCGCAWLGAAVAHWGRTVYVSAEGLHSLPGRVAAWKAHHHLDQGVEVGFYAWPASVQLADAGAVRRFVAATKSVEPVLVVFDTFARCTVGLMENDTGDMGRALEGASLIAAELGALVLLVHHSNKSGAGERGSSALRGAVDTMLSLTAADDLVMLSCEKQRDGRPFDPVQLRQVEIAGSVVLDLVSDCSIPTEVTPSQLRILEALRASFGAGGATMAELRDVLPSLPKTTLYRAVAMLQASGRVRREGQLLRLVVA